MSSIGAELFSSSDIIGNQSGGPSGSGTSGPGIGLGTAESPFNSLNIKVAKSGFYYKIRDDLENVVTRIQKIEGVLIIDGVNTVL